MDTITISKQEFSRLEHEVRSMKALLLQLLARIDVVTNAKDSNTHATLRTFLKKAHAHMPDVSEEEGWQDIEEASRIVRINE